MQRLPKRFPVSHFATRQRDILNELGDGPVILAQRSDDDVILLTLKEWNEIADEMESLRKTVAEK